MVSQLLFHHSLVFGAHLPKVAVAVGAVEVDLLLIMDHIKGQVAVEADEDTSSLPQILHGERETKGMIQQRWSVVIDCS